MGIFFSAYMTSYDKFTPPKFPIIINQLEIDLSSFQFLFCFQDPAIIWLHITVDLQAYWVSDIGLYYNYFVNSYVYAYRIKIVNFKLTLVLYFSS